MTAPAKTALCIGINYNGLDVHPRIPPLQSAEADAQAMAALLRARGFAVAPALLGPAATRQAIWTALEDLASTPAQICVLYFSGHGVHGTRLLDWGMVYFAPYDFDPDDSTLGLPLVQLAHAFEAQFLAEQGVAVFDCCYAGVVAEAVTLPAGDAGSWDHKVWSQGIHQYRAQSLTKDQVPAWRVLNQSKALRGHYLIPRGTSSATGRPGVSTMATRGDFETGPTDPPAEPAPRLRMLVAACRATSEALESTAVGHGLVTKLLLDGWRQGAAVNYGNGQISVSDLYSYVSHQLRAQPGDVSPLEQSGATGSIVLDPDPVAPAFRRAHCVLIDEAVIAAAQPPNPPAPSLYAQPGRHAFWQIVAGQDVRRDLTDPVKTAVLAVRDAQGPYFQLITAGPSSGKELFLWRLRYELQQAGEYVVMPAGDLDPANDPFVLPGDVPPTALDPNSVGIRLDHLSDACQVAANADPARPNRRVCLLLNDGYRSLSYMHLLRALMDEPIDNLTIVATVESTDMTIGAPRPGLPLPAPAGRSAEDWADLGDLSASEAAELIMKVVQDGHCAVANPAEVLRLGRGEGLPIFSAVLALTTRGGMDAYADRLIGAINGPERAVAGQPAGWSLFTRLYYAIAACHAWGCDAPQALLPTIAGSWDISLEAPQFTALLCGEATEPRPTALARAYLQGACGATWRTHSQAIAAAVVRRLVDEPPPARLARLLAALAAVDPGPTRRTAAGLAGAVLRGFAVDPNLILSDATSLVLPNAVNRDSVADVQAEREAGLGDEPLRVLLTREDMAPAVAALRADAATHVLLFYYGAAYILLHLWKEARLTADLVLSRGISAAERSQALTLRGISWARLAETQAAQQPDETSRSDLLTALQDLEAAANTQQGNPNPLNLYAMASVHSFLGHRDQALELLTQALDIRPDYAQVAQKFEHFQPLLKDPAFLALVTRPERAV